MQQVPGAAERRDVGRRPRHGEREPAIPTDGRTRPVRPDRSSRLARVTRGEIILALGLLLCYGFFRQVPVWNEYSRYDLVQTIVETGSLVIDPYHENTGDKAFHDGHYYSDKAPGTALLGAPVYAAVRLGDQVLGAEPRTSADAVEALAFVLCGVPTIILVLLLLRFLGPAVGERWALVVSLGYGLGSIALPFATMFFGHAASTAFLFTAFFLLWRWRADGREWRLVGAGLLAGLAVITEIPVVLGIAVLGVYALWLARRQAVLFVVGGLPLLLVLMAYNTLAFDSPFSLGYQYATVFAEQNSKGSSRSSGRRRRRRVSCCSGRVA